MRFELKMPDLATTDSEIRIGRWMVEPGEKVHRGQPLLEVETDKAAMEVESVVSGVLVEIVSQVDDAVSVGDVIAVFEVADTAKSSPMTRSAPEAAPSASDRSAAGTSPPPVESTPRVAEGAKGGMFARKRGAASPAGYDEGVRLTVAERTASKRLQESKQTIPHFYLQTRFKASAILARREATASVKLTWDAFFVRAVARAMGRFDRFRRRLEGDRLVPLATLAVGVAIDHAGELFVIPVVEPADKSVEEISAEIRANVERLRGGDADARMIRPAAMTISNLGVCNVECFLPIINPPETAILGIGKVAPCVVVREDGQLGVEPCGTLALSVDHRVAGGRYAAEFLDAIVRELESA
ncbi:MAG TPA: hypothetical protein DD670_18245 [Planctomycetaceae bacterium]|nr:hypothetical protein [Planctomycetaceae bacterium]